MGRYSSGNFAIVSLTGDFCFQIAAALWGGMIYDYYCMTIQTIYDRYQLMPNLQLHMRRVAGVVAVMSTHARDEVSRKAVGILPAKTEVLKACLLHDMGNIIKFDLHAFPNSLQPAGYEYWRSVQEDFMARYGFDETLATKRIMQELGVSARVFELASGVGFTQTAATVAGDDLGQKLCEYADTRVAPWGVVSLTERLDDLEKRYQKIFSGGAHAQKRQDFRELSHQLERDIFFHFDLNPAQITEAAVKTTFAELDQLQFPWMLQV